MESFIFYWLAYAFMVFGASSILATSVIFEPMRNFLAKRFYKNFFAKWAWLLITCPVCTSFWIGMIVSSLFPAYAIINVMVLDGVLATTNTVIMTALLNKLQAPPQAVSGCGKCGKKSTESEAS